jgi:hypothetical protein
MVVQTAPGIFEVVGTHAYHHRGRFVVQVSVTVQPNAGATIVNVRSTHRHHK